MVRAPCPRSRASPSCAPSLCALRLRQTGPEIRYEAAVSLKAIQGGRRQEQPLCGPGAHLVLLRAGEAGGSVNRRRLSTPGQTRPVTLQHLLTPRSRVPAALAVRVVAQQSRGIGATGSPSEQATSRNFHQTAAPPTTNSKDGKQGK